MKSILMSGIAVLITVSPIIVAKDQPAQLGPRPLYLIDDMQDSPLKEKLQSCSSGPFYRSDFSIGHRGAAMQFPEHTKESYLAAIAMGAGVLECDVTFTKDKELVCRHSQSDLHTTTDILAHPELAKKCFIPFTPADPKTGQDAQVECRTSDFTLAEFRTLKGKMDGVNPKAKTVEEYMQGTPEWRTDLYAQTGTLMTHAESAALFKQYGVKATPELKSAKVPMPYDDFSQEKYAQKLIDELKQAGFSPKETFIQSFNLEDIRYWVKNEPLFAQQAVFLDNRVYQQANFKATLNNMKALSQQGVKIIAPPIYALIQLDKESNIVQSEYAKLAKQAKLDIIAWTLERSGPLAEGGGWYYQTVSEQIKKDGDMMRVLDVLAQDVGVIGVFSDWPSTVTYYANCMNI